MLQARLQPSKIVMNFSLPPSADDLIGMGGEVLEYLPAALKRKLNDLELVVEDFPDPDVEDELGLETPYDQLAYYKSLTVSRSFGAGAPVKSIDGDVLILYRRPILDLWSETEQDLRQIIRSAMIEELGGYFNLSEHEIEELIGLAQ